MMRWFIGLLKVGTVVLLVVCYITHGSSADILENFAPRLKSKQFRNVKLPPARRTAEILANSFGYLCEAYDVVTDDGYILTLHRIRKKSPHQNTNTSLPVVLLFHGFLSSSDTWLFRGENKDLPYVFADSGYDIWICNARGNVYSRKHVTWDPDVDEEFWNFSFHEMGIYDLPSSIDYILKITKQDSIYFIGHSMGATAFFILCSLKPEYNNKIKLMVALAPAAIISADNLNTVTKLLISLIPPFQEYLKERGTFEIFPQRKFNGRLAKMLCSDQSPTQKMCMSFMFAIVGTDYDQFNATMLPTALTYYPAGTSVNTFMHMYKLYEGNFGSMNETSSPLKDKPPTVYDLSKVSTPVVIFYGDGDVLVSKQDNAALAQKLPQLEGFYRVPHPHFNHLDFMWASDSATLLYSPIIKLMDKRR